jgi:hypothetical protein
VVSLLTPRSRINLVLYHGVLAPHAGWRARVVGYCARGQASVVLENATANASGGPAAAPSSRHWPDAIRTILAAALSRELPNRALPFPTAPDTSRTAETSTGL